jgi:hypothetical protein
VSSEKKTHTITYYASSALVAGAAIGAIFGLMLFETLALGSSIRAIREKKWKLWNIAKTKDGA